MGAGLLGKAIDLGFALIYLRFLGPEGTGAFTFLVVLTTYLDTLVNFGLNTVVARDVSRNPSIAAHAFRAVAVARLGLWLVGLPIVLVILGPARAAVGLPPEGVLAGALFYLALLPGILSATATGLLWADERLELPAIVSIGTTVLKVALGTVALLGGLGVIGLAGTSLVVNLVTAVVLMTFVAGILRRRVEATTSAVPSSGSLLREAWPLFLNQLLAGLFFKVDSLLLLPLAGPFQAGAYAAAYKVIDGTLVIPSSFTLALFPRLSRHVEDGADALARAYRLSLRVLLQVAVPLAAGIAILAQPFVALLGGKAYLPDGAIALALLVWFMPFSFANGLTQYVLIALGRQRFLTVVFVGAFAFNLAANSVLIPRLGYVGAALVTITSEIVLLVPFTLAVRRHISGVSLLREARAPIVATLLMAPVVWWLRDAVHPIAAIVAGLFVYPVALFAVGGIDQEQRTAFSPLMPRPLGRLLVPSVEPPAA